MGPGSTIAPSTTGTATPSSHPYSTQSPGLHASSGGGSSNTGAIVGGVVGGIAAICIAVAAFLIYRRRRSRAQPAVLDNPSGSPTTMRLYVRIFVSRIALVYLMCHVFPYFRSRRTQVIQLRTRGTKLVSTRWISLLKQLCHRTSDLETLWPTHRPRNLMLGYITATPLSDFAPRSYLERIALPPHVFSPPKTFSLLNPSMVVNGVRFFTVIRVLLSQERLTMTERLTT